MDDQTVEALKRKRTYTLGGFLRDFIDAMRHIPEARAAARNNRVSRQLAEKIMLAVTQVNGCRMCNYGHTRMALEAGVSSEDIQHIAEADLGHFPKEEAVALMFAQHYAESEGHPSPNAWSRLVDYYGKDTARDIMAYIRMIMLGNLIGNTIDAIFYRLTGRLPLTKRFGNM